MCVIHSPVHFKTHEHDFQLASLNKILETTIYSASTSPVLSLCVMMNVCIKHKTKPPKILEFYYTEDWNWHHLKTFHINFQLSNFDPTITYEPVVFGLWRNSFSGTKNANGILVNFTEKGALLNLSHDRNFYAILRSYFTIFNMIRYLVYFLKTVNT